MGDASYITTDLYKSLLKRFTEDNKKISKPLYYAVSGNLRLQDTRHRTSI